MNYFINMFLLFMLLLFFHLKNFMNVLVIFEFIAVLMIMWFVILQMKILTVLIFIFMFVMEAVMGLSLLIMMSRNFSNSMTESFIWYESLF